MRRFSILGVLSLCLLSACTSDDKKAGGSGPASDAGISCNDPALEAKRAACEFTMGAMVTDTVGSCVGSKIPIEHIVIVMQENRSFDHYYGHLVGNGQDDVEVPTTTPTNPDPTGGAPLPWHHETAYCVEDTDHGWNASHIQWNGGQMDGFPASNTSTLEPNGSRSMGYYEKSDIPFYYELSSRFAISDRYFCSLLGPTYPNRFFETAGTSFGIVTTNVAKLAPPGVPNIYRSLTAANVTWKDYYTDLTSVLLYPDYATELQSNATGHLDPGGVSQFVQDAAAGNLPQVTFIDAAFLETPDVQTDEHPPANMQRGQHMVWEIVQAVLSSPQWPTTALFITYDEHGGLYDHVQPPPACLPDEYLPDPTLTLEPGTFDRLGFRVPMIVVSPYAKRHYVSHIDHSHTSLLRFLEAKFSLPAFTARDANSDALFDMFDFGAQNLDAAAFAEPPVDPAQITACQTGTF